MNDGKYDTENAVENATDAVALNSAGCADESLSSITECEANRTFLLIAPLIDTGDAALSPIDQMQVPVNPRLQSRDDVGATMGLPLASSEARREVRNAVLLSLATSIAGGGTGVHYSRDRNHYVGTKHNRPASWTYSNVMHVIDQLVAHPNLVSEVRVRPQNPDSDTFVRRRSVIFPGAGFVSALPAAFAIEAPAHTAGERIICRDSRKRPLPIVPSHVVDQTKGFFAAYDAAVAPLHFSFADGHCRWIAPNLAMAQHHGWQTLINIDRRYPRRIFTGDLNSGGRFYGTFWQELPKPLRRALLINGEAVAEHDYAACHLRLAYFGAGASDADGVAGSSDRYTLDGFGQEYRPIIKRAVQILLNAKSLRAAVGAIARDLRQDRWEERLEAAHAIIVAIKARHPALQQLWHSSCGLALQFVDAELSRLTTLELLSRGIVPLGVHDSMIVAAQHHEALIEAMERRFNTDGHRLAEARLAPLLSRRKAQRPPGFRGQDLTQGSKAATASTTDRTSTTLSKSARPQLHVDPPAADTYRHQDADGTTVDAIGSKMASLPLLADLAALVRHRGAADRDALYVAATVIRAAFPHKGAAQRALDIWLSARADQTCMLSETDQSFAYARLAAAHASRGMSGCSAAKICKVNRKLADSLHLSTLRPKVRPAAISRRASRLSSTLPRLVDVGRAAPWGGVSRTQWYSNHGEPSLSQPAALMAHVLANDREAIANVRRKIDQVRLDRAQLSAKLRLPVDGLLAKLNAVLAFDDCIDLATPHPDVDVNVLWGADAVAIHLNPKGSTSASEAITLHVAVLSGGRYVEVIPATC